MPEQEEKKESEILFSGVEVYGVKIKPWTFDQFVRVIPLLKLAYKSFEEKAISFEKIDEAIEKSDPNLLVSSGMIDAFSDLLPKIPEFISLSLSLDIEEIREWDFDKVFAVAFTIIIQNAGRIKNLSGLGAAVMRNFRTAR
jgi:hypothetical protein